MHSSDVTDTTYRQKSGREGLSGGRSVSEGHFKTQESVPLSQGRLCAEALERAKRVIAPTELGIAGAVDGERALVVIAVVVTDEPQVSNLNFET